MAVLLSLMDRAALTRDGVPVHLEPRVMAVLIRLALEPGKNVRADDLCREVLMADADGAPHLRRVGKEELRRQRLHVYKCISAIRKALDPARPGRESELLIGDPGRNPGYRLMLPPENIDLLRFERLVADSRGAPPVRAAVNLRQALDLWRGRPLVDVETYRWAKDSIARAFAAYDESRSRLLDLYETFDRLDEAVEIGESLLADRPGDVMLRERIARLTRLRSGTRPEIRLATGWWDGVISVCIDDLLEQNDAHLVVGFTDTFETNTTDDFLVARSSLQGQLVERLYAGDHRRLHRDLRKALQDVPRTVESRAVKRYGNLSRFPVGTVAVVPHNERRIFAVAYSKVGPDGRHGRSSPDMMRTSLNSLWTAARMHGRHRAIAIPVVGSGLARIHELDRIGLIGLIVETFLAHQSQGRLSDELRIVVRPQDAVRMDLAKVEQTIADAVRRSLNG